MPLMTTVCIDNAGKVSIGTKHTKLRGRKHTEKVREKILPILKATAVDICNGIVLYGRSLPTTELKWLPVYHT